jgi:hypothetical protein
MCSSEQEALKLQRVAPSASSQAPLSIIPHADLTDQDLLRPLLSSGSQSEGHMDSALQVVRRTYESKPAFVGKSSHGKNGMKFPMHPEILHWIMTTFRDAKDKIGLEIAGASGENSALLAFAGLGEVYLNDIDSDEIKEFETLKLSLPEDVRSRLKSIKGDFFAIEISELINKVDLILCRNFLHFLTDQQIEKLFSGILPHIATPEAHLIFSVNSPYTMDVFKSCLDEHPEATRFKVTRSLLTIFGYNNDMPCHSFFNTASVCEEDVDPLGFTKTTLYEISDSNFIPAFNDISQFTSDIQELIKTKIMPYTIDGVDEGRITLVTNTLRVYTPQNLSRIFEQHGLQVKETFLIEDNGHRLDSNPFWEGDLSERVQQVGVIAQWGHKD